MPSCACGVKITRIPCATNYRRYEVFTVPRLSQRLAVSGIPLDNLLSGPKPFSVYPSPLSRPSALCCDSSGHRWSRSSSPSDLDSVISLGAKQDKNIFARHANEAVETNVRLQVLPCNKADKMERPLPVDAASPLRDPHDIQSMLHNQPRRCQKPWMTDVDTPRPRKRLCLGERKYLVVQTNQRGSLLGFFNFAGCCHAIGQVSPIPFDLVLLGSALASTGLALDARKV